MKEETKKTAERRTIRELMGTINGYGGTPKDRLMLSEKLLAQSHNSIDVGYIKTLLFPELYNADIPQPMSTQSYCRFTDKRDITIQSSSNGMLIWFPKTVIGPQLFLRTGSIDAAAPLTEKWGGATTNTYKKGGFSNYQQYFSQVSLVSAAISIQYIGQAQHEQGFMVGGQVYGVDADFMTPEYVETGQFRVMGRPGDGMRMIYLPKDSSDFQYYSSILGTNVAGALTKSGNNGAKQSNSFHTYDVTQVASTAAEWIEGVIPTNIPLVKTAAGASEAAKIDFAMDCDMIVIYWKGLQASPVADLRIDLTRKFNGFPLSNYREILDLVKPKKLFDPKKTIDVVCELQDAVPQLAGHTVKQMDRISDQIQEFLPNVGHLYNEGMLKEGTSLDGFAAQLQGGVGTTGQSGFIPGNLY